MSNIQFTKNTNVPEKRSPLWKVGNDWKISGKTGIAYQKLDDITDIDLGVALCEQYEKEQKEEISYMDHFFVGSVSQDGNFLVYAFKKDEQSKAQNKLKYEKPTKVPTELDFRESGDGSVQEGGEVEQEEEQVEKPIKTTPKIEPQRIMGRRIEVVEDMVAVEWNDAQQIEELKKQGLYQLPIINVGNNRLFFEDNQGKYLVLYGRIVEKVVQQE